jgi:16S rRNA (guanine527-N7)-methyltransferase
MEKSHYNINEINILIKKILIASNIDLIYLEKIKKLLLFLLDKNLEMNLISRKLTLNQIIDDHFFDCLVCWKFFKKYISITDLGSGGGLPGILLAIIFPEKKINLIEKSKKKVKFLSDAIEYINLNNVKVIEGLVNEQNIQSQVITCRAFKNINTILSFTKNFFNKDGIYILYKGKLDMIKNELIIAQKYFKMTAKINKIDKIKDKERHIVIIKKS